LVEGGVRGGWGGSHSPTPTQRHTLALAMGRSCTHTHPSSTTWERVQGGASYGAPRLPIPTDARPKHLRAQSAPRSAQCDTSCGSAHEGPGRQLMGVEEGGGGGGGRGRGACAHKSWPPTFKYGVVDHQEVGRLRCGCNARGPWRYSGGCTQQRQSSSKSMGARARPRALSQRVGEG
jgi:hypothetical protein